MAEKSAGEGAERTGIAHTLALAAAAGVAVKVEGGRLVVEAPEPRRGIARAIETYLTGLGQEQVIAFLTGTTEEERRLLSAIPPVNARKVFRRRLIAV